ncbi:MAG TPA: hypothetical protein VI670_23220 [Thermoanaerobaculia bacterium]|jgi:hypothetical protein
MDFALDFTPRTSPRIERAGAVPVREEGTTDLAAPEVAATN